MINRGRSVVTALLMFKAEGDYFIVLIVACERRGVDSASPHANPGNEEVRSGEAPLSGSRGCMEHVRSSLMGD